MHISRSKKIKYNGDKIDDKTKEMYEKQFALQKRMNPIHGKISDAEKAFYLADFDDKKAEEIALLIEKTFKDDYIFTTEPDFQLIDEKDTHKYDRFIDMENEPEETVEKHKFKKCF